MRKLIYGIIMLLLVAVSFIGCDTKKYKVTFRSEFHVESVKYVEEGKKVSKPTELTFEGYKFIDWYLEEAPYDFDKAVTEDIVLDAKWEKLNEVKEFTVTFKDTEENVLEKVTVKEDDKLVKPTDPVREGLVFSGWYRDIECTMEYNFDLAVIEDFVLYAKFVDPTVKYTVIFKGFNGETLASISVEEGDVIPTIAIPNAPVVEGYKFIGWDKDFTSVTSDLEINAIYEAEITEWTISFENVELEDIIVLNGEKLEKIADPVKEGFDFVGWFTDEACQEQYDFEAVVSSNLTLYAKFTEKVYTITYILNGGKCDDLVKEFKHDEIVGLPVPERYGYSFAGWYETVDGTDVKIEVLENKNYKLKAKWEALEKYAVNYDLNGGKFTDEIMTNFEKEIISMGSFTITQQNVDFWEIYSTNVFIYSFDQNPKPTYSLRIGLARAKLGYKVMCEYMSGSTENAYPECDYVIVVSEHNAKLYSTIAVLIKEGQTITLDGFDPDNMESKEVNIKADVVEEGELTTKGKFYLGEDLFVPERSGYEFLGWFDENNQKVEKVQEKEMNVIAKWARKIGPVEEELDLIENKLSELLKGTISKDLDLITSDEEVSATISWSSSDENIITKDGKVTRVLGKEAQVVLTALITLQGTTREASFTVNVAKGYKDLSKGGIIGGYNYTGNLPDDTTLKNVDILYCAFGEVGTNGKISNYSSIKANTKNYVDKAHTYGTYVLISISTSNLATVAASDELINVFADDLVNLINECNLDGIDMDWETPTQATATNYTRLMKVVREKVKGNNSAHLVTSALGAGPWQYVKFDLANSHKYLDYINLMSYDMQTNAKSSYHNALYKSSKGYTLTQCSIDQTLPLYNALGVPNEKIIIGVPFYARVFKNTNGLGQASEADGSATQQFLYTNFLSKSVSGVTVGWDDECKVPYIYDANNRKFYSYENEKSIGIKCEYIHDKGLAGMMYWQRTQDYNNKLLNAIYSNKSVMENK